jgi:hypothetical protein
MLLSWDHRTKLFSVEEPFRTSMTRKKAKGEVQCAMFSREVHCTRVRGGVRGEVGARQSRIRPALEEHFFGYG